MSGCNNHACPCLQARQHIRQVSLQLLQAWKPPPAQTSTPSNTACGCDRAADSLEVPQPGAFPCTLLAARDKDTGQALSDEQVGDHSTAAYCEAAA